MINFLERRLLILLCGSPHMPSRAPTSRSRFSNSDICYLFNHNQCFYNICKFCHVSLYCHSESHPGRRRRGLLCLTNQKGLNHLIMILLIRHPEKKSRKLLIHSTVVNSNQELLLKKSASNRVESSSVGFNFVHCNSNQPAVLPPVSSVSPYNFLAWLHRVKNCPSKGMDLFLQGLCTGFSFGCSPKILISVNGNMPSVYQHPEVISDYLKSEIEYNCIVVLLNSHTFPTFIFTVLGSFLNLLRESGV